MSDYKTPELGGREVELVADAPWFKLSSEYFPVSVHKSVDLDPTKNYLFGYHPHGIICIGALHPGLRWLCLDIFNTQFLTYRK